VSRPGLRVESEVGFVFDVDDMDEDEDFSAEDPL
jgi:hypothetical protein